MNPTFPDWLAAVFDHPVGEPEWYWAPGFDDYWQSHSAADELSVEHMTLLFTRHDHLAPYSLEQVAQGIWFMIGESSPAQLSQLLVDSPVPLEKRVQCIMAMWEFFRGFVAAVAPGESQHDTDPFHIACYMWWDIFPCRGGPEISDPSIGTACLTTLEKILAIPSELCQISGLHGLHHWQGYHPDQVESAIARFIKNDAHLSPRVREYAQWALQ